MESFNFAWARLKLNENIYQNGMGPRHFAPPPRLLHSQLLVISWSNPSNHLESILLDILMRPLQTCSLSEFNSQKKLQNFTDNRLFTCDMGTKVRVNHEGRQNRSSACKKTLPGQAFKRKGNAFVWIDLGLQFNKAAFSIDLLHVLRKLLLCLPFPRHKKTIITIIFYLNNLWNLWMKIAV